MDLFELLFIAFFILIPVLDGILKKRRQQPGPPSGSDTGERPGPRGEPTSAADMVPEDLWEVLTGQRRRESGSEPLEPTAPWSSEPERPAETAPEPIAVETPGEDWRSEPWAIDEEPARPEPVSLEYRGPEAYSLEDLPPPPETLERPLPSARARHDAFHDRIDRDPTTRRTGARSPSSPLIRALRRPEGLRQAVLMKEILGPPRGLE